MPRRLSAGAYAPVVARTRTAPGARQGCASARCTSGRWSLENRNYSGSEGPKTPDARKRRPAPRDALALRTKSATSGPEGTVPSVRRRDLSAIQGPGPSVRRAQSVRCGCRRFGRIALLLSRSSTSAASSGSRIEWIIIQRSALRRRRRLALEVHGDALDGALHDATPNGAWRAAGRWAGIPIGCKHPLPMLQRDEAKQHIGLVACATGRTILPPVCETGW